MEQATDIKNSKVLLASLRSDIIEASTALTSLKKERESLLNDVAELHTQAEAVNEAIKDERQKLQNEREGIKQYHVDAEKAVEKSQMQLDVLKKQRKEALKELKQLNEWIFTAEEKKKELFDTLYELEGQIDRQNELKEDTKRLEDNFQEAQQAYQNVLIDTKLVKDETELKVHKAEDKVQKAEKKLATIKAKVQKERENLKNAANERNRIEKDLEIYIARVKKKYEETFPGKEMKL